MRSARYVGSFALILSVLSAVSLTSLPKLSAEDLSDSPVEFLDFASPQGIQLLANAAAVPGQIMRDLATSSENPSKNLPDNQPLTYLLLYRRLPKNAYEEQEFTLKANLGGFGSATVDSESDTVNALLPKHISQVAFAGTPLRVTGIIEFSSPDVFHGKVTFVAVREKAGWKVTEFAMPARGLRTQLKSDGKWKISSLEPAEESKKNKN